MSFDGTRFVQAGDQRHQAARLTELKTIGARSFASGHALCLAIVGLGCLFGQAVILARRPLAFELPDSASYIALATRLVHEPGVSAFFDPYRTPGYPALLAVIGWWQGAVGGEAVVYAQAGLMVITSIELYALTYGLSASRPAATVAAFLFSTNVRLLDWERLIMTEAVAIFLVATIALAFCLWFTRRSKKWAVIFAAASILAILTRPSLLYVPGALLAVALVAERRRWLPIVVIGAAAYLPIAGYAVVNDQLHPRSGLSAISSINLLGKVLEYGMQGEGASARYPVLWQGISQLAPGDRDPYNILKADPTAFGVNFADAAGFSEPIIFGHPLEYLEKSAVDFVQQWSQVPFAYIPPGGLQGVSRLLAAYALLAYAAYPALPLAVIALVVMWRGLDRERAVCVSALVVVVLGGLATNALFTYVDFARLKTPIDPLALVIVVSIAALVVARAASGVRSRQDVR